MTSQLSLFDGLKAHELTGALAGTPSSGGSTPSVSDVLKQAVDAVSSKWKAELEKVKGAHHDQIAELTKKHDSEVRPPPWDRNDCAACATQQRAVRVCMCVHACVNCSLGSCVRSTKTRQRR